MMAYTVGDSHIDILCLCVHNIFINFEKRYADSAKLSVKHFNFLSGIYLQGTLLMGISSNITWQG